MSVQDEEDELTVGLLDSKDPRFFSTHPEVEHPLIPILTLPSGTPTFRSSFAIISTVAGVGVVSFTHRISKIIQN
jgi:hypothetical protein